MWILLILGLVFTIIGVVAYAITMISLVTSSGVTSDPTATPPNISRVMSGMLVGFGIAIALLLAGGIIELIGRIGMLIKQAKQQQWTWFVCTLLLGWVCMLIYLIVWPETPQPVMPTSVYVPQYQPMPPYQSYERAQQQQGMEQRPPQE